MNCTGIFGRLLGHNYQPCYSKVYPSGLSLKTGSFKGGSGDYERMIDAWKENRYHGHVCTRCGHAVNMQKGAA